MNWSVAVQEEANARAIRETLISLEFQSREECYYHVVGSQKRMRDITRLNVGATSV